MTLKPCSTTTKIKEKSTMNSLINPNTKFKGVNTKYSTNTKPNNCSNMKIKNLLIAMKNLSNKTPLFNNKSISSTSSCLKQTKKANK